MAVRIRLRRMGAKKRPFYRFVAADSKYARNGRFLETLGYYNPMEKPAKVKVEAEKIFKWLKNGAQMSETVNALFKQIRLLDKWEKVKAGESGDDVEIKSTIHERKRKRAKAQAASTEVVEEATVEATPDTTEETPTENAGETDNS